MLPLMFSYVLNSQATFAIDFLSKIQASAESAGITEEGTIYIEFVDSNLPEQSDASLMAFNLIDQMADQYPLLKLGIGNISSAKQIYGFSQFSNVGFFALPQAGFSVSNQSLNDSLREVLAGNEKKGATVRDLIFQATSKGEVEKIKREFGFPVLKIKIDSGELSSDIEENLQLVGNIFKKYFSANPECTVLMDVEFPLSKLCDICLFSSGHTYAGPYVGSHFVKKILNGHYTEDLLSLIRVASESKMYD